MYYGLESTAEAWRLAHKVCDVLGYGASGQAHIFILEICAVETQLGQYRDPTDLAGMGPTQFDEKPFEYIKATARRKHKALILKHFSIEVDRVQWFELQHNPLLAFIFTRLFWLKRVEPIPATRIGRAEMWKKFYNSYHPNAKGTVAKYLANAEECLNEKSTVIRCPDCGKYSLGGLPKHRE